MVPRTEVKIEAILGGPKRGRFRRSGETPVSVTTRVVDANAPNTVFYGKTVIYRILGVQACPGLLR